MQPAAEQAQTVVSLVTDQPGSQVLAVDRHQVCMMHTEVCPVPQNDALQLQYLIYRLAMIQCLLSAVLYSAEPHI